MMAVSKEASSALRASDSRKSGDRGLIKLLCGADIGRGTGKRRGSLTSGGHDRKPQGQDSEVEGRS
jgi:hypothetical protein